MTVREANLTAASSADRETEIIETGGTARLHLTLATPIMITYAIW